MTEGNGMLGAVKKWFMTQVWRFQQVAMMLTLIMMAATVSLNIYSYMKWREGSGLLANTYVGVSLVLLTALGLMWVFAYVWDKRAQMWREQMIVSAERNPFMRERLCAKDIVYMTQLFMPSVELAAASMPEKKKALEALDRWIELNLRTDDVLLEDTKRIFESIGMELPEVVRRAERKKPQ